MDKRATDLGIESTPGVAPKMCWTLVDPHAFSPEFHWYGEEQTQQEGESKTMATKLTKANEKYLVLLEEVESAQAEVTATETTLSVQRQFLAEKRKKVADFEAKHRGETLLKPYKVPTQSPCNYKIEFSGSGYYCNPSIVYNNG